MNFTSNRLTSLQMFKLRAYFEKVMEGGLGVLVSQGGQGGQCEQGGLGALGGQSGLGELDEIGELG